MQEKILKLSLPIPIPANMLSERWMCFEPTGKVRGDIEVLGPWECLTLCVHGQEGPSTWLVSIRSCHGTYLSAQPNKTIVADRPWGNAW